MKTATMRCVGCIGEVWWSVGGRAGSSWKRTSWGDAVFIRDNDSPWTALGDVRVSTKQYTVPGGEGVGGGEAPPTFFLFPRVSGCPLDTPQEGTAFQSRPHSSGRGSDYN